MQRRSNIQASSLIISLSMLTIFLQLTGYYYIHSTFILWTASVLMNALCCHILQQRTFTFNATFHYSLLNMFMILLVIVLTYGSKDSLLPYSGILLGIAVISWLVPALSGLLRHLLTYGVVLEDYKEFFRNTSIVFILFYTIVLLVGSFGANAFPWAYRNIPESANLVPLKTLTNLIENYTLDGSSTFSEILSYLLPRLFLYLPYGFYIALAVRKYSVIHKLLLLISLPLVIEILQYFIINRRSDIDDFIFAFLGGILGIFTFFLVNLIFRVVTGKEFLKKETGLHYTGNLLHF